jgi:hypothetical protein
VAALLPWAAAGTLQGAEQAMVERHLQGCAACRADLAWQREFQAAMPDPAPQLDADAALARLLPRLVPKTTPWWRRPIALGWLVAGQTASVALLAVLLVLPGRAPAPPAYRALGATSPRAGDVIIQFRADASAADIGRILQANGAHISDGPTAQGAYLLTLPASSRAAALQALRRERAVLLAESLDAQP